MPNSMLSCFGGTCGGASSSHLSAARRRGRRGARAAADNAGDRVSRQRIVETRRVRVAAIRQGLKETGYVEGRNVAIEYRWAEGQYERLAGAGGRAGSPPGRRDRHGRRHYSAWRPRRRPQPFQSSSLSAPIRSRVGLVASLNRPGGNLTGVSYLVNGRWAEAVGVAARDWFPKASIDRLPRQPDQSRMPKPRARSTGGGGSARAETPCR